ncbi:MAG: fibronectin type III domain-containing protein [Clostridia bacterium]|nr:fibronectin type III domain-containing protein [Clostridia bacterium]
MKKGTRNVRSAAALCMTLVFAAVFFIICAAASNSQAQMEQRNYYKNKESVMSLTPKEVTFSESSEIFSDNGVKIDLDGAWSMIGKGKIEDLCKGEGWDGAISANVPGSIYTALFEAGVIEDPYLSDNMKKANDQSKKNWYYKKTFDYNGSGKNVTLNFEGVCNVADFYLNGVKIGTHEGMFGGPYIDITDTVKKGENVLVVHLKPAKDYTQTVVFNCSYGWHYAKLFPLGIWQSVSVTDEPDVTLDHPFITTCDYKNGTVDLAITLTPKDGKAFEGQLKVQVSPKNFDGKAAVFEEKVSGNGETVLRYRGNIPDPHLWWPNGYGEQYLYDLNVTFEEKNGGVSYSSSEFGIRELSYAPFPSGERGGAYNRQFVINGVKVYMKGAGWCTIDAMMRFTREDYDRILSRAKDEGVNYVRSWGGGLVETDEFYDLCDEYGICVYQEWPCCWDSTKTQPADVLYETVILGCKRLRNRPSLVIWGGGNEGEAPYNDKVLNNMGKLTYETDGTREFWRQDGGTGAPNIRHDHIWWSGASPEYYLKSYTYTKELNMSEYGLGSMMNLQSIRKFATEKEISEWPIGKNNSIAYHTATFNGYTGWTQTPYGYDIAAHMHYASLFTDVADLDEMILGSQLSQAQADYPLAINSRIKAPSNTANVIYKLNDCYPGASWSIVDWYGAPNIAHYLMQDAYRTVMAAFQADRYNTIGEDGVSGPLSLPVYILDDTVSLKDGKTGVIITAYDENLNVIKTETFDGRVSSSVNKVGVFDLTAEQTAHTPMTVTADLTVDGEFYNRTYMYFNYEREQGSLFYMPRTHLDYTVSGNTVKITNSGSVPAIGVHLDSSDEVKFVCSDGYFILTPGQSVDIEVNDTSLFTGIGGFNIAAENDKTAPTAPQNVKVSDIKCDSVKISWSPSQDDGGLLAYYVALTDEDGNTLTRIVHGKITKTVISGLSDLTGYTLTVTAADNNSNRSANSAEVRFRTEPDVSTPTALGANMTEDKFITVTFNTVMDKNKLSDTARYILNHGAAIVSADPSEDGRSVVLTVSGADQPLKYTLGVIGLTDTKKSANNTGYQQLEVERDLYLCVDFEPDPQGVVYTSGKYVIPVTGVNSDPRYTDNDSGGKALSSASGWGAKIEGSEFAFPENSSVVMRINGKAGESYNVLMAKGPKESGHFEFYARSGNLYVYAPDIGDIDLRYNINGKTGWRTLAFVRENGKLTVYDDGREVSSVSFRGNIAKRTDTVSFGVLNDGSLAYAGSIDFVRFYERALKESELAAEKAAEVTVDVTGNDVGKSAKTDFSMPGDSAVNLWFYKESSGEQFAIFVAKSKKSSDKHFEIYTESDTLCIYSPSGVGSLSLKTDIKPYVGSWHMLTVVHTEDKIRTYIDGSLTSEVPVNWNAAEGADAYYIGRLVEGGFDFPGSIAECEFIDHAPSGDEISALYKKHVVYPDAEGGLDFAQHLITLEPGQQTDVGITVTGNLKYGLSVSGESVVLDGTTVKAEKTGQSVIYARSENGGYISALLVTVKEHEEEQTEPVTENTRPAVTNEQTKASTETEPEPVKEPGERSNTVLIVVIVSAFAAAAVAAVAVIALKKKKKG